MELKIIGSDFGEKERLYAIYEEAFPVEERIPTDEFLDVVRSYGCTPWALYDGGEMVGFTCVMPNAEWRIAYIWFLAVAADKRCQGYGSKAILLLREQYAGSQLVLDMEPIDPASANSAQRLRRLAFYERCGFVRAFMDMSYFGMDFELMSLPAPLRLGDFKAMLCQIKDIGFRPKFHPIEMR